MVKEKLFSPITLTKHKSISVVINSKTNMMIRAGNNLKIRHLLLFCAIFIFGCSDNLIKKNKQHRESTKRIVDKNILPLALEEITLRIDKRVPEISYSVIDKSSDSIFFLEIYNIDSNLVGEYSILPVSLSKEKVKDYEYWAFRSSCIIGALNPKIIKYKNFIFRPKCGFNNQNDKDLLNKFNVAFEEKD